MFAGKKSAQIREILINESAWEEMTCLFAPSLVIFLTENSNLLVQLCNVFFYRVQQLKNFRLTVI
ncbi:hypothetical protein HeN100_08745 [Escherichia coli]|nr:hypothetical protein [Escherichia coli]UZX07260.1 hypothetical protein HeN100_08745 [Escherichia coli]